MEGIKGILDSKKAVAGGVLIVASVALVLTGKMSVDQWISYSQWIFGIYAAAETTNATAAMITNSKRGDAKPAPAADEEQP